MKVIVNIGLIIEQSTYERSSLAERNEVDFIMTCLFLNHLNEIVKLVYGIKMIAE